MCIRDRLKRIGITASDLLVEVQRDQLVAGYVGQTAPKTQEKIDEAIQGVLFVDEAYRLSQGSKSGSDYGKEAIETLMGAMNEPPGKAPVMVFAGYPNDMASFMQATVWKSNFGRPAPSTQRAFRSCVCAMAWRRTKVHAIFLR